MTRGKCDPTSIEPDLATFKVAAAGFANMFCIGTVYALSTLQAQLPRLFGISYAWSFAPFGVACLGLSIGVLTSASMIIQSGAHVTVARGTSLWGIAVIGAGLFLKSLKFELMVTCFLFGGLGIGWMYLAVVALIGQGLPRHALARSAIGPLGFSSAATICFLLSSVSGVEAADAETLGRMLVFLGVTFAAVGASTQLSLSDFYENSAVRSQPKSSSRDCGPFFSILLFFNALPGMTVFSGLLPLASHYTNGTNYDIMWILSYCMIALAFGGVLAPSICAYCGVRLTFVGLLCLRGVLLILLSHFEHSTQVMCTMLVVLFAHGTGFSILPGLIKTQSSNQQLFYFKYARVLISWGVSGIVGSIVNSIVLSSGSPVPTGWLLVGLLTLSFGIVLNFVPTLGGEFFD
ncbi:hypothetical protein PEBR_42814 [Penicillium brasilianum]|uniref:Uncharacterized protein n=1 Tax=Penicillium brasilianum TaxID=104259 RepID=A0A1S9R866_PENBI|nr:hypothetical protein PEBR_42814 [Penicillium brasilianum]